MSVQSLIDWQNFLREIADEFCNQSNRMIGGEGVEIEVDETCVLKGSIIVDVWCVISNGW